MPSHYLRRTPSGLVDDGLITLSSQLILQAAEELGIAYEVIPNTRIIRLSYNGRDTYFRYQISTETTDIGFYASDDKRVTNTLLERGGVQVNKWYGLTQADPEEYWKTVYDTLTKPLVVKPSHGNQGTSVVLGITDYETYTNAVRQALSYLNFKDAGVIVEEMFDGKEYRVLATREKVLGVLYRRPANVVGDGKHTIAQLIEQKNADPRRGTTDMFALFKIVIDDDVLKTLAEQNLTLDSVPTNDEFVYVRRVSNIARGGDSIDVTDSVHPSVKEIALRALNAIPGLDFAGVDFMTTNSEAIQTPDSYRIVEINASPGFCIQEFPFLGEPRRAQYEFLYLAFPELRPEV